MEVISELVNNIMLETGIYKNNWERGHLAINLYLDSVTSVEEHCIISGVGIILQEACTNLCATIAITDTEI